MTRLRASSDDATPLGPSRCAPWLGVTGALLLLVAFLRYNGWCGLTAERWPWDVIGDGALPLRGRTILALWLAAGAWSVLWGWTRARRVRAVGGALLAGALFIEMTRGADVLLAQGSLAYLLVSAALAAGLLVVREPSRRRTGRVVAGVVGLLFLWLLVYPVSGDLTPLEHSLRALGDAFGEHGPPAEELWTWHVPVVLSALAALGGLLAGLGWTGRRVVLAWFLVLLAAWLVHLGALAAWSGEGGDLAGWVRALLAGLTASNALPWLLAALVVRDLANGSGADA